MIKYDYQSDSRRHVAEMVQQVFDLVGNLEPLEANILNMIQ